MLKVGFISQGNNDGKTLLSLGLADALSTNGHSVIFLNFNNKDENPKILSSYCQGTLTGFINKKCKIRDIITRVHELNLDLINAYPSDLKLLTTLDEEGVKNIMSMFVKSLASLKKYDYIIINGLTGKLANLNIFLSKVLDYLVIPIDINCFDVTTTVQIHRYIQTMCAAKKKNNTFLVINKFDKFSNESNSKSDQLRLIFDSILLDIHIPILDVTCKEMKDIIVDNRILFSKLCKSIVNKIHQK